jgi:glycosyltransferase involved in cell wall biosynthesis
MTEAQPKRKQSIACCAIMKNESPYIHEWVAHYAGLGFDEICVYENDSSDRTAHLLKKLEVHGHIRFRSWPSLDKKSPQVSAYEDFLSWTESDWVLFCDADEFLVLNKNSDVHEFIQGFSEDVSEIAINWRIFGSSGHEKRTVGYVIERFQKSSHQDFQINRHVKSFVKPSRVTEMHIHAPRVTGKAVYSDGSALDFADGEQGISPEIKSDVAVMNHYFTRSKEEWNAKKMRGNANRAIGARDKFIRYHEGMFNKHDRNEVDNVLVLKYLDGISEKVAVYLSELK